MQKHPKQVRLRHLVPSTFVAVLLLSAIAASFSSVGRLMLFLVAGSYVVSNLAAAVLTARTGGWRHLPLFPLVFTTLHLGYGLGFLKGLLDFLILRRTRMSKIIIVPNSG